MRIAAFSDTHTIEPEKLNLSVPDCDVLLFAGDWSPTNGIAETTKFAQWFSKLPGNTKIVIPGNHDGIAEDVPELTASIFARNGITYLLDKEFVVDGKKFYGTPWTTKNGFAFTIPEHDTKEFFAKIPSDVDVLITHCPPLGGISKNLDGKDCGSRGLYQRAVEICMGREKPLYHFYGHIHKLGETFMVPNYYQFNISIDGDGNAMNKVTFVEI